MKKLLSLIVLLATLIALPGCSTTGGGGGGGTNAVATVEQTRRAAQAAVVVETSAQLGTYYALRQDPNTKAYFQAAVAVITVLIDSGSYEPTTLQDALKNISVRELRSEEVSLAVAGAVALYANFFGEAVATNLDRMVYAKPVLTGLRNGITKGLAGASTERTFNLPPKKRTALHEHQMLVSPIPFDLPPKRR